MESAFLKSHLAVVWEMSHVLVWWMNGDLPRIPETEDVKLPGKEELKIS